MKTAVNELIEKLVNMSNSTYFNGKKSDCDIIDKIKDMVRHQFLEKEKQQIIDAYDQGFKDAMTEESKYDYYNETFS